MSSGEIADWDAAKKRAGPALHWGYDEILAHLNEHPVVAHRMIEDVYDAAKTEEERLRGIVRTGRRPRRQATSLDEVWSTIFPEPYSMDPFPDAMVKLLNGQSQRAFSRRVPCHQTTLSRMMAGKLQPDRVMLEQIAAAANVRASYFREWRALALGELVTQVMLDRPNVSVTVLQRVNP